MAMAVAEHDGRAAGARPGWGLGIGSLRSVLGIGVRRGGDIGAKADAGRPARWHRGPDLEIGPSTSYGYVAAALSMAGIGMALPLAPTAVVAVTSVPEGSEGEATGLFNLADNFGRPPGTGRVRHCLAGAGSLDLQAVFWFSAIATGLGITSSIGLRPGRAPRRELRVPGAPASAK